MGGKIISHYKILDEIGRGGMGVVYKAEDTKLQRTVALKVLSPVTIGDPEAKRRFIREARAASKLSHPNITTIHEIDEWHGRDFICMEYVEGQTLRKIISNNLQQVLNQQEVINYATQIAEALQEAHEHNIIHRDIKSENIMVTSKGQVKVMDFGLAQIQGTMTKTQIGATPGTIAYMSPEQTRGETVDHRTDIWSFGVVLYEILTGQLPFKGEYEQAVIYSILNEEPEPIIKYRTDLPSDFQQIQEKMLAKEPKDRYQTAHEVLLDLKKLHREYIDQIPIVKKKVKQSKPLKKLILIGSLILLTMPALIVTFIFNPFSNNPLKLPNTIPFTSLLGDEQCPAISPNGSQIAFMWNGENQDNFDIYVKEISVSGYPTRLTNHPGFDFCPVWSPDGKFIVFARRDGKKDEIYIMSALGKAEHKLCETNWRRIRNLAWSHDGQFLALSAQDSAQNPYKIFLLSLETFEGTALTSPPSSFFGDIGCVISPDNKKLAFARLMTYYNGDVYFMPINGGVPQRVTHYGSWIRGLSWTKDGREIIFSSNHAGNNSLWCIPITGGNSQQIAMSRLDLINPTISQSGNLLAYEEFVWNFDIYRIDLLQKGTKIRTRFISSTRPDALPRFSPDGKKIAFASWRSGPCEIWTCDSDGNDPLQMTNFNGPWANGARFSPDGSMIVFDVSYEGPRNIFLISAFGGQFRRLTNSLADECSANWSPDGKWIYFHSNRNKEFRELQIWKISPQGGEPIQVTQNGGWSPFISSDGKWLYYANEEGIWKREVDGGPEKKILNIFVDWNDWTLCDDGIYYKTKKDGLNSIEFYDFKTESITTIVDGLRKEWLLGIDVSPDGRWLIYCQQEPTAADIILVENFR
jgi:serine/threonine protein kinase